jgi:hypothetical protein
VRPDDPHRRADRVVEILVGARVIVGPELHDDNPR